MRQAQRILYAGKMSSKKYKNTAIFSQLLLVNGILQKEESVTNIIAIKLEDISYLLDEIEKINLFKSL